MQTPIPSPGEVQDQPSKILNILSFFCPPLGLIIYLSLVGKLPRQALSAGLSGAKGVATLIALYLLVGLGALVIWLATDVLHLFPAQDVTNVTSTVKPPVQAP